MILKIKYFKSLFIVTFLFLLCDLNAQDNAKTTCDSLIKNGVKAYDENKYAYSLELLNKALSLAKKKKLHKQEFLALNNIGNNYTRFFELGQALDYLLEAHKIAIAKLTPKDEMVVINNIAILYAIEKDYEKANEYFSRAFKIAKETNDTKNIGKCHINFGSIAIDQNNPKLALKHYDEAVKYFDKNSQDYFLAKGGLTNCYFLVGNSKLAIETGHGILKEIHNKEEMFNIEMELLITMSKVYLEENKLDLASFYASKLFEGNQDIERKIRRHELLFEINVKKKEYNKAIMNKDSIFILTEKINEIKNQNLFENSKIKFELQDYKHKALINETKLKFERKILYAILLMLVLIVLIVFLVFRNKSLKLKQKKIIAERNEKILQLELENKKNESLILEKQLNENIALSMLEQEKLKNEVELKNRKLSAKALYLSGRNEMIEVILAELTNNPQILKEKSLIDNILSLKDQLKKDNEWGNFISHFEEINQAFFNFLTTKHVSLTVNDIRYLSYIYMGLSTKEIASMLNITQESCRKRKERVLTKMGLSKETNLYDYLISINSLNN